MTALAAGLSLGVGAAFGWLMIGLVTLEVLRQRRAAKAWRPDPPREEDLP